MIDRDAVIPERKMGKRVARLVNERLIDFIGFGDDFAIASDEPVPQMHDVKVVGDKRAGEDPILAVADTITFPDDELVVSGRVEKIEKFSAN